MEEVYASDFSADLGTRLRDMEEKHRLLRDRILLIGQTFMKEKDKTDNEMNEIKYSLAIIKEENIRIIELLERVTEQLQDVARKEELNIIQRQLDLFRKK